MQDKHRPPERGGETDAELRLARKIRLWEALRRWMLILAALLMIGGYVADFLPVLYSSALPLCVMLIATLRIKRLEGGGT